MEDLLTVKQFNIRYDDCCDNEVGSGNPTPSTDSIITMKTILKYGFEVFALCLILSPRQSVGWGTHVSDQRIRNRTTNVRIQRSNFPLILAASASNKQCKVSKDEKELRWYEHPLRIYRSTFASLLLAGAIVLVPNSPVRASPDITMESTTITISSAKSTTNVVEEVWTLVDKYYIDPKYGGQNWKDIREKYLPLSYKNNNEDSQFKLASEMVAMLNDKYTRMLTRDQYSAIQKYDLIGVGVTLMPDANKNIIVGAPPIPGSEAARVGMNVGDFVTAINDISTTGKTAFDIIDQISENPSAKTITMSIRPKASSEADPVRVVTLSRAFTDVKNPVQYKISETRPDGTKVGYIKITEFNALVKGSLEKALSELEAANVNAYVLDIRQNTGGAFQSAVEISSLFTEGHIATYVVDNTNMKLPFRTATGQIAIDKTDPIVILIDSRSASASEVLAGSLHDNCRAVLMGERSFGKGLIQAVYGLKNGEGLVMTVARYITPSGHDIQGVGIEPDFELPNKSYLGPLRNIGTLTFGMDIDTSKINFNDIQSRLNNICKVPTDIQ